MVFASDRCLLMCFTGIVMNEEASLTGRRGMFGSYGVLIKAVERVHALFIVAGARSWSLYEWHSNVWRQEGVKLAKFG